MAKHEIKFILDGTTYLIPAESSYFEHTYDGELDEMVTEVAYLVIGDFIKANRTALQTKCADGQIGKPLFIEII